MNCCDDFGNCTQGKNCPIRCWCTTCRPITIKDMRMVLCPDCGNKRCPRANDHNNACTNSNAVGQKGSSWEHVHIDKGYELGTLEEAEKFARKRNT